MSDLYPGWEEFEKIVKALEKEAKKKKGDFAKWLVECAKKLNDEDRCGCAQITADKIEAAIESPQGRDYHWEHWAGKFKGKWNGTDDNTEWGEPETLEPKEPDSVDGVPSGKGKFRKQHVKWFKNDSSVADKEGWNVSGPNEDYVWGWDPKENTGNAKGHKGTHVGFPLKHKDGECWCIVWVTEDAVMLECMKDDGKEKCRFGIAVSPKNGDCFGHGKWTEKKP